MKTYIITPWVETKGISCLIRNQDFLEAKTLRGVNGNDITFQGLKKQGYDTNKLWRTYGVRKMTHGEIGCALSHIKAWEQCVAENQPILVLEDDAVVQDNFNMADIEQGLKGVLLVGFHHINEPKIKDEKYNVPTKWTNAHAYAITPDAAKTLIDEFSKNIYPVDDFMSDFLPTSGIPTLCLKEQAVKQIPREESASTTEPREENDYFIDFDVHVFAVGTDKSKMSRLIDSCTRYGVILNILGEGQEWHGGNMAEGAGGGQKINLLREAIKDLPEENVVLFLDGYDVFVGDIITTIVDRYLGFEKKVLFSAEKHLWPDSTLDGWPEAPTEYRYLNSGCFIGEVAEIKKIISEEILDSDDDQLYYQKKFLSGKYDIGLDYEAYIFQTHEPDIAIVNNPFRQLLNLKTNCCPTVYHGNGGKVAKQTLNKIYLKKFGLPFKSDNTIEIVAPDMFMVPLFSREACNLLIEIAETHGNWEPLPYDKFPAQEIRAKELGLFEAFEKIWAVKLNELCESQWLPMAMYGLRDAFIMKYTINTQKSLALHTDASMVTGSVKLNDDYEGADLYFPRQKFSTKHVPVGHCLLFPGQVTHGHECETLKNGVKYSLTMWTKRFAGDKL